MVPWAEWFRSNVRFPQQQPETVRAVLRDRPHFLTSPVVASAYLSPGSYTIGRFDAEAVRNGAKPPDLSLVGEEISGNHAVIKVAEDRVDIADARSTNGTFVNGFRVTKWRLKDGDRIACGEAHRFGMGDEKTLWVHLGEEASRRTLDASAIPRLAQTTSVVHLPPAVEPWDYWLHYLLGKHPNALHQVVSVDRDLVGATPGRIRSFDDGATAAVKEVPAYFHVHARFLASRAEILLLCPRTIPGAESEMERVSREVSDALAHVVNGPRTSRRTAFVAGEIHTSPRSVTGTSPSHAAPLDEPIWSGRIVLFGDSHFGAPDVGWRHDHKRVNDAFLRDLKQNREDHRLGEPLAMLVAGDIAYSGAESEYREARAFLEQAVTGWGGALSMVRIDPGNHDVDRGIAKLPNVAGIHFRARALPRTLDDAFAHPPSAALLLSKLHGFVALAASLPGHPTELDWRMELRPGVSLLGLSTVSVSDEHDDEGKTSEGGNLVLAKSQLTRLVPPGNTDRLRLLLSHHPMTWLQASSASDLRTALAGVKYVHLCGHVHEIDGQMVTPLGGGETGITINAGAAHRGVKERGRHSYARIVLQEYSGGRFRLGWSPRVYVPERNEFTPDRTRYGSLDPLFGYSWTWL